MFEWIKKRWTTRLKHREMTTDHCTYCGYPKKGFGCLKCKGWKLLNNK